MNKSIPKEQRIFVLKKWWTSGKTYQVLSNAFQNEYPNEKVPSRQAIYQLAKKFEETGSVDDAPRSGRPTTARTEENMQLVSEAFPRNPQLSQRRASTELNMSRTNLRRLMKDLKLKSYKPMLLQALNEDDPYLRLEFCEWILENAREDPSLLGRILWTDEAIFQTNGPVNRRNCVYWNDSNPHLIIEQELNVPRVTVWRGIWSNGVIGPFFLRQRYVSKLLKHVESSDGIDSSFSKFKPNRNRRRFVKR